MVNQGVDIVSRFRPHVMCYDWQGFGVGTLRVQSYSSHTETDQWGAPYTQSAVIHPGIMCTEAVPFKGEHHSRQDNKEPGSVTVQKHIY